MRDSRTPLVSGPSSFRVQFGMILSCPSGSRLSFPCSRRTSRSRRCIYGTAWELAWGTRPEAHGWGDSRDARSECTFLLEPRRDESPPAPWEYSCMAVRRWKSRDQSSHHRKASIHLLPACKCGRSEEHTSELQSQSNLVCRLLLEKKKKKND